MANTHGNKAKRPVLGGRLLSAANDGGAAKRTAEHSTALAPASSPTLCDAKRVKVKVENEGVATGSSSVPIAECELCMDAPGQVLCACGCAGSYCAKCMGEWREINQRKEQFATCPHCRGAIEHNLVAELAKEEATAKKK